MNRLCARSMIRDWSEGNLDVDLIKHAAFKMEKKNDILQLSLTYQIVSEFTSFVAIEDRQKSNQSEAGAPTIQQLIDNENVDELGYMDFERPSAEDFSLQDLPQTGQIFDLEALKKMNLEDRMMLARIASSSTRYNDLEFILGSFSGASEEEVSYEFFRMWDELLAHKFQKFNENWNVLSSVEEELSQKSEWNNLTRVLNEKKNISKELIQFGVKSREVFEELVSDSTSESNLRSLLNVKSTLLFKFFDFFFFFETV